MDETLNVSVIIKNMGGPSAASRFFECKPSAVSQWVRENKIPNARLLHLKAARPDLFGPSAEFLEWQMTPHEIRADLYPNPGDAMPRLIPAEVIEDRRQQDQRAGDRRALDLIVPPVLAETEKPT